MWFSAVVWFSGVDRASQRVERTSGRRDGCDLDAEHAHDAPAPGGEAHHDACTPQRSTAQHGTAQHSPTVRGLFRKAALPEPNWLSLSCPLSSFACLPVAPMPASIQGSTPLLGEM